MDINLTAPYTRRLTECAHTYPQKLWITKERGKIEFIAITLIEKGLNKLQLKLNK
jgi:hypothetical protein